MGRGKNGNPSRRIVLLMLKERLSEIHVYFLKRRNVGRNIREILGQLERGELYSICAGKLGY